MSYPLIIRPEAEQDLSEARDWYNRQREGLGDEFLTAVDEEFDRIRRAPGQHPPEYKSIRRSGLNRFPYVAYYRIIGKTVEVIAVQHGSRDPHAWQSRA